MRERAKVEQLSDKLSAAEKAASSVARGSLLLALLQAQPARNGPAVNHVAPPIRSFPPPARPSRPWPLPRQPQQTPPWVPTEARLESMGYVGGTSTTWAGPPPFEVPPSQLSPHAALQPQLQRKNQEQPQPPHAAQVRPSVVTIPPGKSERSAPARSKHASVQPKVRPQRGEQQLQDHKPPPAPACSVPVPPASQAALPKVQGAGVLAGAHHLVPEAEQIGRAILAKLAYDFFLSHFQATGGDQVRSSGPTLLLRARSTAIHCAGRCHTDGCIQVDGSMPY